MRAAAFLVVWWIGATTGLLVAVELSASAFAWVREALRARAPYDFNPMTTARSRIRVVPRANAAEPGMHTDPDGWRTQRPGETIFTGYSAGDYNVVVFGGSTTFGDGVADGDTVPAQLGRMTQDARARDGRRVRVFNAGLPGYALRRETYLLADFLREGRRIDLAVFYDGVNEDCADRERGAPPPAEGIALAYDDPDYSSFHALVALANREPRLLPHNLRAVRMLRGIGRRLLAEEPSLPTVAEAVQEAGICAAAYLADARFARRLARAWGTDAVFVLQPGGAFVPGAGTHRFPRAGVLPPQVIESMRAMYLRILAGAKESALDVRDWSGLLEAPFRQGVDLFLDTDHLTGQGNAIVARKFYDMLLEEGRIRER